MASLAIEQERFDMGRVVSLAFGAIGRNLALYLGLAILLIFIPGIFSRTVMSASGAQLATGLGATTVLLLVASSLVSVFFTFMLQAALSYATVTDLNGGRPSIGAAVKVGVQFAIPILLLSIVTLLGVYAAMLLLIFPGLILALMWSVATPVMVTEHLGVFASLGRSRQLTKGSRWSIFGLLLVAVVVLFIPLALAPLLTGALANPAAMQTNFLTPVGITIALLSAAASMLLSAIVAAIYVELRTIKEGVTVDSLASIFA